MRFTLINSTEHEIDTYLQQRYPLIGYLDLYIPMGKNEYQQVKTGKMLKFSQRPVDHRTFVFPLKLCTVSSKTYYMRYESQGSINIVLNLFSPKAFNKMNETEAIFIWMFYGIMVIMILYNFIIFLTVRDLSYLLYVLYIFFFAAQSVALEGIAYQYLWPNAIWWGTYCKPIFAALNVCFIAIFISRFTKSNQHFPRIDKGYRVFGVVCIFACIATLFPFVSYRMSMSGLTVLSGLGAIYLFLTTFYMALKKSRPAQFVFTAFCLYMVGATLYVFKSLGIILDTAFSNYTIQFGGAAQVTILSLGLADRINTMRKALRVLNLNLEDKVQQRTEELQTTLEEMETMNSVLTDTKDQLWGEMVLAKKIQTVLLPENPEVMGYQISAYMEPADEVGGDYYDVINVGGFDWFVIGDVSGHGVPAGLIMMMVQTSIRSVLEVQPNSEPSELLAAVNSVITENIKKMNEDKYMTITVLACMKDGVFCYSGLHQDIMVYRADSDSIDIIETNGMWLGIFGNLKGMVDNKTLSLNINDTMLVYTDGITEARKRNGTKDIQDSEKEMFGEKRLMNILQSLGNSSPEGIKAGILHELSGYECDDDVTMMILRRAE